MTDVDVVGGPCGGQLERSVECELRCGAEALRDPNEDGAAPSARNARKCVRKGYGAICGRIKSVKVSAEPKFRTMGGGLETDTNNSDLPNLEFIYSTTVHTTVSYVK